MLTYFEEFSFGKNFSHDDHGGISFTLLRKNNHNRNQPTGTGRREEYLWSVSWSVLQCVLWHGVSFERKSINFSYGRDTPGEKKKRVKLGTQVITEELIEILTETK